MDKKIFEDLLTSKEYIKIEKMLKEELKAQNNLNAKYLLGISYSEQYEKREEAKKIFKELINTNIKDSLIYSFIANHTKSNIEKVKIINEGLIYFPSDELLNNQLLMYLKNEEKEEHFKKLLKENIINYDGFIEMIDYYFQNNNYEEIEKAFYFFNSIYDIKNDTDLTFIRIVSTYLAKKLNNKNELVSFIISDNNTICGLIIRLIEIDLECEKNYEKSIELIQELNFIDEIYDPFIFVYKTGFMINEIFYNIIENLKEKFTDEKINRKLELILSLQKYDWEENLNKTQLKKIQRLIEEELKNNKQKILYKKLLDIYNELDEKKKYFDTYINIIKNNYYEDDYISFDEYDDSEIDYVINKIKNEVWISDYNKDKYEVLFEQLIRSLHIKNKPQKIINIIDKIDYKKLNYLNFGFEIAYSFKELNRDKESKETYEEYIKLNPECDAALNNLGVFYEQERDYEMALELYEKSEKIIHNDIYTKNIKRCEKILAENKKEEKIFEKALEDFEQEDIYILSRLKLFYSIADEKSNVICTHRNLSSLLKCSPSKASELLDKFLDKKYILKIKSHDYETSASVYKINNFINKKIIELENDELLISSFTDNLDRFTINNLKGLDYIKIKEKLYKIEKEEYKEIFIRDYNELVFNYLTNQYKTTVLLSGTIVELLLLYILENNSIKKYAVGNKLKEKKIQEMDITDMLEVCEKENILHKTPQKFIDGIKNFRNFIHPGKELREKLLSLNKQTVDLSMDIVRWLILEIEL